MRTFDLLSKKAGLPKTTFHAARHIAATTHKNVGTPLRDAQEILGHANSEITRMIYQHGDIEIKRQAIEATENTLNVGVENCLGDNCCQKLLSKLKNPVLGRGFSVVAPPRLELGTQGSSGRCSDPCITSVIKLMPYPAVKHLCVTMRAQILGAIAVKTAVILYHDHTAFEQINAARLQQYLALRYTCGDILLGKHSN